MTRRLLAITILCAGAMAATADVYTTTGDDGETVYTDKPEEGAQRVQLRSRPAAGDDDAADSAEEAPAFESLSPCEQARFILREYRNAEVLADRDEAGEVRVLSDAEAEAKRAEARADVERLCSEEGEDDDDSN